MTRESFLREHEENMRIMQGSLRQGRELGEMTYAEYEEGMILVRLWEELAESLRGIQ